MNRQPPLRLSLLVLLLLGNLFVLDTLCAALPLWKVEGGKSPVWLLGSFHLLKPEDYPLPGPIEDAYSQAQVVVFEADMAELNSPDVQLQLLTKGRLPEGERLKDHLSEATYQQLMEHAAKAGIPAFMLEPLKPSLAVTMIVAAEILKLGYDPNYGVDLHFFRRCQSDDKTTVPLETIDFQIDLLLNLTGDEEEPFVKSTLAELDTFNRLFDDLVDGWRRGDTEALDKCLNDAKRDAPAMMERLLTDRNKRWIPKIKELANGDRPVLVIVGAGHLVGESSVVDLLKEEGLKPVQQ